MKAGETKRRDFLKLLGIGGAAGLTGCTTTSAPDRLVPYMIPPEEMVRGQAVWFRSTCRECPAGCGIEVRVREGRVHKVEGNPSHPVNGGGLCARGQAAVQGLYNPDRIRTPRVRDGSGQLIAATWEEAEKKVIDALAGLDADSIGVITGAATGSISQLASGIGRHLPFEPIAYESLKTANRLCFGAAAMPVLRFADARIAWIFGADVIETFVSPSGYARGIAEMRRAGGRLVYAGSRLSLTGARADQWIATAPGTEGRVAMALLREVLRQGGGTHLNADERARLAAWSNPFTAERAGLQPAALRALASELRKGPALAATGGVASCGDAALATAVAVNLLNVATGAVNRTITFDRGSALDRVYGMAGLRPVLSGLKAVLVVEANPVYAGLSEEIAKMPLVVALSSCEDETTAAAHVVLPVSTPLESWGDYEPWTGIHSLQQPAMLPVFNTREPGDMLLSLAKARGAKIPEANFRDYVRNRWRTLHREAGSRDSFDAFWTSALRQGGLFREMPGRTVRLTGEPLDKAIAPLLDDSGTQPYVLQTYPSLAHFDGRGANRPWLQELPDPLTQVVWDSWAELNPKDAARLGIETGNRIQVRTPHGQVEIPAYVYPGVMPGVVAVPLGQGHTAYGQYATGVGVNAMALLDPAPDPTTAGTRWCGAPVVISRIRKGRELAIISGHNLQEHRGIARSLAEPHEDGDAHQEAHPDISIYPPHEHREHRWAMVIDLDACNACSACVTSCYAENNVPVVGKEQVDKGRIMSWIRVQRYWGPGSVISEPVQTDFTMMLCQHCDHAPCESVCPVFAAYHNSEGLNGQVYNRCVGTRYCSNNCPYKTRRFNWYEAEWPAPLDWQLNPDVTVRSKGVMEKCTFCIQRIVEGKDRARREGRPLRDGDILPACAQSCPAGAIIFGDLNDVESRVAQAWKAKGHYRVFENLNTRPAVTYLERERRRI